MVDDDVDVGERKVIFREKFVWVFEMHAYFDIFVRFGYWDYVRDPFKIINGFDEFETQKILYFKFYQQCYMWALNFPQLFSYKFGARIDG